MYEDINIFKHFIYNAVDSKCMCNCVHDNHSITFKDDTMKKHKHSKSDGCTDIWSDHIIHAGDRLAGYVALLFTSMKHHRSSPDDMLLGTMIPLLKGKWIILSCSDNYRAITLSHS